MITPEDARGHVLLADDEPAFQRLGGNWLRGQGHQVSVAADAPQTLAMAAELRPDVVLLDLSMPPRMDPQAGLDLIPALAPALVIVLTGHADHARAVQAASAGAWDFIAKPADPDMLAVIVARAVRKARLDAELRGLRAQADAQAGNDDLGLAGTAPAMAQLRDMVRRLGPTEVSVIVLGPTGTGKELVARALHATSKRARGLFVAVHCGALPSDLLESELFGHLKGSFTGAHRDQVGVLETAHRGTLFLDEVGEMPLPMQVKLLRFLQEGTFTPVGARSARRADVRVVAATHRDLPAMVADGSFREDFYYRLRGMVVRTPSLAERRADVPLLAARFLRAHGGTDFTPRALDYLVARDWPGNVRELRSCVEAAASLTLPTEPITESLLRFVIGDTPPPAETDADAPLQSLDEAVAALETRLLRTAMAASGGNQSEAARRLGISRVGLIKKLARLKLR